MINSPHPLTGYLPPPIKPTQLAQRLLQQSKYERLQEESGEVQEIEMEVDEQEPGEEQTLEQAKRPEGSQPPAVSGCAYVGWGGSGCLLCGCVFGRCVWQNRRSITTQREPCRPSTVLLFDILLSLKKWCTNTAFSHTKLEM